MVMNLKLIKIIQQSVDVDAKIEKSKVLILTQTTMLQQDFFCQKESVSVVRLSVLKYELNLALNGLNFSSNWTLSRKYPSMQ